MPTSKSPTDRVFKTSTESKAGLFLEEKGASLVGDSRHFITVDDRGVTIRGPVSFVSDTMGRRTAGLFVGISDFLEMIPQTLITPIPSKIPFPPVFAMTNMLQDVAFFMALLV
jgi:hypothetical protein